MEKKPERQVMAGSGPPANPSHRPQPLYCVEKVGFNNDKMLFEYDERSDRPTTDDQNIGKGKRTPAICRKFGKTLDAGMALLTMGLAWHYKKYEKEQPEEEREQYSFAETEARGKKVGLWSDAEPVPP